MWWEAVLLSVSHLRKNSRIDLRAVDAIGISYQMHGLVIVDENFAPLRPSIIWCDSRAVEIGARAAAGINEKNCLSETLNLPGNFTASRLRWIRENEPDIYSKIHKFMLPGDFIAMKLTGEINTTRSGLSECILWDFQNHQPSRTILEHYDIQPEIIPDIVDTFGIQGQISPDIAAGLGFRDNIPVSYRAGDQPNNAFSLNVLEPGEIAATAGTSGVVYGINGEPVCDPESRVNIFLHVNNTEIENRNGVLLCVNGTGILNRWLKENITGDPPLPYIKMNMSASEIPVGSDGLIILPYGNGAERTLNNRDIGASVHNLDLNIHTRSHFLRAAQEGIVFALDYGLDIMRDMGLSMDTVRAGHTNMFLSPVFSSAFANTTGAVVELYNTDGAQGAARAAGVGAGIYKDFPQALNGLELVHKIEPDADLSRKFADSSARWRVTLKSALEKGVN